MNTTLSPQEIKEFLQLLKERFQKHEERHPGLEWDPVEEKLLHNPKALWSIYQMEATGGEPDVVVLKKEDEDFFFLDCAPESPLGRRNLCYDQKALEERKKFKPEDSAMNRAKELGIELLNEEQYRRLQEVGSFDQKTSSWIHTPEKIRNLGGALFCDRRFDTVFVYHNGAESYYSGRGFRGFIRL